MTKHLGKRVIVTGGAMGLGRAIANLFASEGAQVTVADIDASAGAETLHASGREEQLRRPVPRDGPAKGGRL